MIADRQSLEALFEGAPRFLDRLEAAGPFETDEVLFEQARAIAHTMPADEQIELVDAHPRLGAHPEAVSELSFQEQGYDRGTGTPRSPDVAAGALAAEALGAEALAAELGRLNAAYEARFGFRYCVFVAGRTRAALLPEFAATLGDDVDRGAELHRALDAVVDIAIDRHGKLSAEAHP